MSWNPFSRTSSSQPKKSVLSRPLQRDFEREVKRLDELEELSRRLHKDVKKLTDANAALAKTERKLSSELLDTPLCRMNEPELLAQLEAWDTALGRLEASTQGLNGVVNNTVRDPLKKFVDLFPYAHEAIKKRDQTLQEYQRCGDKVQKYQERERTGQTVVKLNSSRSLLTAAQTEFLQQNSSVLEDLQALTAGRTQYMQPSVEAWVRGQVQYTTEAVGIYGDLSAQMNGNRKDLKHDYKTQIYEGLSQLRALDITAE